MDDIFESLTRNLGKNPKVIVISVIVYIFVMIGIIVAIWWPEKKNYIEYEDIDIVKKQNTLASEYVNNISLLFRTGDKAAVKNLISNEYIDYIGKSRDTVIEELDKAGYFSLYSEIKGVDLYVDGNTYVYTTTMYYKDKSRSINIVEKSPYKYELVFDDFYRYNEVNKSTTSQGINFTITDIYRNLKYIEMNVKIENKNKSYIRLNFNNPNCVQAVLEDGKTYSISNLISSSQYIDVESNTTITKNIVFQIPAQLQNSIKYIVFNGVSINFATANIKVNI